MTPSTATSPPTRLSLFAPVRQPGWYRPLTEDQAASLLLLNAGQADAQPVHYVPPKHMPAGAALKAHDSYGLLHQTAFASQGARQDLAEQVVDFLVAGGEDVLARCRRMTLARLDDNLNTIKGKHAVSVVADLYGDRDPSELPWFHEDFPTTAPEHLSARIWHARHLRYRQNQQAGQALKEDWHQHEVNRAWRHLQTDIAVGDVLLHLGENADKMGNKAARVEAAQMLADRLEPWGMIRAVDDLDPNYGLSPTDPDSAPDYGQRLHISALDLAIRHWDEVNAKDDYPSGINLARHRTRLYPASAIEPVSTKVHSVTALDTAKTSPATKAAVVPLFSPTRPAP